ncbi:MAG: hypothetical protein AUJ52_07560 [Elusimicrobia bacterium CG1_02_63_36]|nr:MAG: hypothetical protein AUJ52_07560 [Elusimicrobia bacterium CG1_02_63_36]
MEGELRVLEIAIKLRCPIEFRRIRNGEKNIVQTGPDGHEVDVRWDDEPEKFQSQGSQTARAKNHWAEALRVLERGAKLAKRTRTRSRRVRDTDGSKKPPL